MCNMMMWLTILIYLWHFLNNFFIYYCTKLVKRQMTMAKHSLCCLVYLFCALAHYGCLQWVDVWSMILIDYRSSKKQVVQEVSKGCSSVSIRRNITSNSTAGACPCRYQLYLIKKNVCIWEFFSEVISQCIQWNAIKTRNIDFCISHATSYAYWPAVLGKVTFKSNALQYCVLS